MVILVYMPDHRELAVQVVSKVLERGINCFAVVDREINWQVVDISRLSGVIYRREDEFPSFCGGLVPVVPCSSADEVDDAVDAIVERVERGSVVRWHDMELDMEMREVKLRRSGREKKVSLSPSEAVFLKCLMESRGRPVPVMRLMRALKSQGHPRVCDTFASRINRKLGQRRILCRRSSRSYNDKAYFLAQTDAALREIPPLRLIIEEQ